MESAAKNILILVLLGAVLVYTVSNYLRGELPTLTFLVYMAVLCIPVMNIVSITIRQWKDR